jgi:hypothetical protein
MECVYKSIYCQAILDLALAGDAAGNLSTHRIAPGGTLLGKRLLLVIELMLPFDTLVGQFVCFPVRSFLFSGHGVDSLVRRGWLRTVGDIRISFICHGFFTRQATLMRRSLHADARHGRQQAHSHKPIRRRHLSVPQP